MEAEAVTTESENEPSVLEGDELDRAVESLVFVSERPVPVKRLSKVTGVSQDVISESLARLTEVYAGRGIQLVEVATGFQFRTASVCAPLVRDFMAARPVRLTRAQLETLSISAYRQPLTRPELEEIRGVDSGSALRVLLDRGLLRILGRKDEPGRPLLYGTTPFFLEFFGMRSMKDLPTLKEFTDLSDESRALFERKMGEPLDVQAAGDAGALESADAIEAAGDEAEQAGEEADAANAEDAEDIEDDSSEDDDERDDETKETSIDPDQLN